MVFLFFVKLFPFFTAVGSAGGGSTKEFAVSSGKRRVAAEPHPVADFGGSHALRQQIPGQKQAAFRDVIVDGGTGLLTEPAHHVKFA